MAENQQAVKKDIEVFYENQSAEKTSDIEKWLNSGKPRIPQPLSYYYFENRKINNALSMSRLPKGAKILEVGCNLGQMTFVFNQKGYSVVGTDLSHNAVEKANLRVKHYKLSNISFEVQDAEDIKNHEDGEFDAAFSFSVLRYVPNPDKALQECYRLVKSGGVVVVDFPNRNCPWFNLMKPAVGIKKHIHDRLFDVKEVRGMMEKTGFRNIEIKQFLFSYKELPSILLPFMVTGDFILERIPVINKMSAIIMVKGIKP
jgi:ubiquinone/menaquinone biosynthesis C-methylase UbiE